VEREGIISEELQASFFFALAAKVDTTFEGPLKSETKNLGAANPSATPVDGEGSPGKVQPQSWKINLLRFRNEGLNERPGYTLAIVYTKTIT
jgi:hypothetical protein